MGYYDVAIVGGGASGTALVYALARYTDIKSVVLVEKYSELGSLNSNARNNSQTLHTGEIETNYTAAKVRQVKPAARMVKRYTDSLPEKERGRVIRQVQKMVLGVGGYEVEFLECRYEELKSIFPELQKLDAVGIAQVEPAVMRGRGNEDVIALYSTEGYAVNYGELASSLAQHAQQEKGTKVRVLLEHEVVEIQKSATGYSLHSLKGDIEARVVVVDADAHSLGFAKKMGLGHNYSLIPIAGSFYFSPACLRGKVYRVQEPRMPFAALHGDPEITRPGVTRWGPTARFYPVLEAHNWRTMFDFFAASGLHRPQTWISFVVILLDPLRFWYLLKNFFYDLPWVGKYFLLPQIRAIVPAMQASDLWWAKGYGGMRLQRVDTRTREMQLGEGKLVGENIVFNMTPSPGASVCLYNAMRDAELVVKFLPNFTFNKEAMLRDLGEEGTGEGDDVSLHSSYAS